MGVPRVSWPSLMCLHSLWSLLLQEARHWPCTGPFNRCGTGLCRKPDTVHVGPVGVLALPPDVDTRELAAMVADAQEFATEWAELRAVLQNRLHGRCLRSPLQVSSFCLTSGVFHLIKLDVVMLKVWLHRCCLCLDMLPTFEKQGLSTSF